MISRKSTLESRIAKLEKVMNESASSLNDVIQYINDYWEGFSNPAWECDVVENLAACLSYLASKNKANLGDHY